VEHSAAGVRFMVCMRLVRAVLACGLFLALPLVAAAQAELDPTPTPTADVGDPTTPSTTRTIEVSAVEAPFANVSVADSVPVVDEDEAVPQATPSASEKLPPGPASRWP
jgi:hypothetical protein